jgi:O-antigen/teichoic acid export membrane protein
MLGVLSEIEEVGIYSASVNISQVVTLVLTAFIPVSMSIIVELYEEGRLTELANIYQSLVRWILIFTLPIFLIILFASEELLLLFGKTFAGGGIVLVVLSFGQLFNAGTGPVGRLMEMTGHQDVNLLIVFAVLIFNAVLNLALIPPFGALGAAIATSISTICVFTSILIIARRLLRFQLIGPGVSKIALMAVLAALIGYIASLIPGFEGSPMNSGIIIAAIVVLLYGLLIATFGLIRQDRTLIRLLMDRAKSLLG